MKITILILVLVLGTILFLSFGFFVNYEVSRELFTGYALFPIFFLFELYVFIYLPKMKKLVASKRKKLKKGLLMFFFLNLSLVLIGFFTFCFFIDKTQANYVILLCAYLITLSVFLMMHSNWIEYLFKSVKS